MKTLVCPTLAPHVPGDAFWLGINVHRLRLKKGMTQEQLASAAGISVRRLRDIEDADAHSNTTVATVSALSKALGVELAALFKHHKDADLVQV